MAVQSGFIMLAMLVLLFGVGSGWISVIASHRQETGFAVSHSPEDLLALSDARQALLNYATHYAFLYGPTGAGPAHLPCPDTDGYRRHSAAAESGRNQNRDGPNPPCPSLMSSSGLLPRHVNLPGLRYAFHNQSWQRFHYEVADDLINNPLNRIVNPELLSELALRPAASISLPSPASPGHSARATITRRALADGAVAAVAAWIIRKVREHDLKYCDVSTIQLDEEVAANALASPCMNGRIESSECPGDRLLALLVDQPPVADQGCLEERLKEHTIDGIPATRHWFIRNRWAGSVMIGNGEHCLARTRQGWPCELVYSRPSGTAVGAAEPLLLSWVPSDD